MNTLPDACENCETPLAGPYCHQCGQRHEQGDDGVVALFRDGLVGTWHRLRAVRDGWYLLVAPGFLTAEFLRGRRVRHAHPWFVWLTWSAVGFAVAALAPPPGQAAALDAMHGLEAFQEAPAEVVAWSDWLLGLQSDMVRVLSALSTLVLYPVLLRWLDRATHTRTAYWVLSLHVSAWAAMLYLPLAVLTYGQSDDAFLRGFAWSFPLLLLLMWAYNAVSLHRGLGMPSRRAGVLAGMSVLLSLLVQVAVTTMWVLVCWAPLIWHLWVSG